MIVTTTLGSHPETGEPVWYARTAIPPLGVVTIGAGRTEYQAQAHAAQFLDRNYPNEAVTWEGGYHGGNTAWVRPRGNYWGD